MTELEKLKEEIAELKLRLHILEMQHLRQTGPPVDNPFKCPTCLLERSHTYVCFRADCHNKVKLDV